MGPAGQPDYINAVVAIDTLLEPVVLLHELQKIENQQGRVRTNERWGPRTIDLDILVYDDRKINTDELTVPHLGIHERAFVLYPLQEIAPELDIPGLGSLRELIAQYDEKYKEIGLKRLDGVA
jgi:2-amino-4-hydroxy-6-hydroxymethyldihydropteridine diphosphokinase